MQSRVTVRARDRNAVPACLGGIASLALADQHHPGGLASLGGQLQPPPGGQRQRLRRLSDHQPDSGAAQGFLDGPQKIDLAHGADDVQPVGYTFGQATQHWQMPRTRG